MPQDDAHPESAATPAAAPAARSRRPVFALVVVVAVAVAAATAVVVTRPETSTAAAPDPAPAAAVAAEAPPVAPQGPGTAVAQVPVYPTSPPVEVRIPAIGISQSLIGLRVATDGSLEVPQDFDDVGWFSEGYAPGDQGPAVLVGHVDSKAGPAAFYELDVLAIGDLVQVRRADGTLRTYAVTDTQSVPKLEFPTEFVYVGDGGEELKLVTCGGTFDRSSGHYLNNTIVTAEPLPEGEQGTAV